MVSINQRPTLQPTQSRVSSHANVRSPANNVSGYSNGASSYSNGVSSYSNGISSYSNSVSGYSNGMNSYSNVISGGLNCLNGVSSYSNGGLNGLGSYSNVMQPSFATAAASAFQVRDVPPSIYMDAPAVAEAHGATNAAAQTANAAQLATITAEAKANSPEVQEKAYASMLNGMTSDQLKQEKESIEQQMKGVQPGSAEHMALQKKLAMADKELKSRPEAFFLRVRDDRARQAIQNDYASKSTSELQTDLEKLFEKCSTSAAGNTPSVQSNHGVDTELQIRMGAIQTELTQRGVTPITPERLDANRKAEAAKKADDEYQAALKRLKDAEAAEWQRRENERLEKERLEREAAEAAEKARLEAEEAARLHFEWQRREAIHQLWANLGMLGGIDKIMSRGDLQKALDGKMGAISQGLREAIHFLFDNPAVFNEFDTAKNGGNPDGKISKGDLERMRHVYGL